MADDANQPAKALPLRKRLLEWSKDKVLGGLVVTLIAIGVGWWLNSQISSLRIVVSEVHSVAENLGQFDVTLENDGSHYLEDLELEIKLKRGKIKSAVPDDDSSILKASVKVNEDAEQCLVAIPRLNRGEALKITVLASDPFELSKRLSVAARGKDVEAKRSTSSDSSFSLLPAISGFMAIIIATIAVFGTLSIWLENTNSKLKAKDRERYLWAAQKIFAFLNGPMCGRYIVGMEAFNLYESMTDSHTRLEMGGVMYYLWAKHDDVFGVLKLEMVCGEAESTAQKQLPHGEDNLID